MDGVSEYVTPRIGDPVPRKEDLRLLTGRGAFSDDVNLDCQAYAAVVRSPHAHAVIEAIEIADAMAVAGVLAVLTGADALAEGLSPIPRNIMPSPPDIALANRDGSDYFASPQYVLPADKTRFVGEALAMVIAETEAAAKDGAEQVRIAFSPLPSVTVTAATLEPGAPVVWDDAPENLCVDADVGDRAAADEAFAGAAHVVRFETWIRRVTGVPMEPRAAVGDYDPNTKRYTVHAGSGNAVRQKRETEKSLHLGVETQPSRTQRGADELADAARPEIHESERAHGRHQRKVEVRPGDHEEDGPHRHALRHAREVRDVAVVRLVVDAADEQEEEGRHHPVREHLEHRAAHADHVQRSQSHEDVPHVRDGGEARHQLQVGLA